MSIFQDQFVLRHPLAPHSLFEDKTRHTNANDIKLETTLQELPFYLGCDAVETNVALGEDRSLLRRHRVRSCHNSNIKFRAVTGLWKGPGIFSCRLLIREIIAVNSFWYEIP